MTQILRAQLADISVLSGYLHDSNFDPSERQFHDGTFSLSLRRVSYEHAQPGRVCFFVPVVRYPVISAEFRVFGVLSVECEWKDERDRDLFNTHTLLSLEASEDILIIETEWLYLNVRWKPLLPYAVELIDRGEVAKITVVDSPGSVFTGTEEIDRLRVAS